MTKVVFLASLCLQILLAQGQSTMSLKPCASGKFQSCFAPPCSRSSCDAYPQAECRNSYCEGCNSEFWVGDREVTALCDSPNPSAGISALAVGEECNGPVAQCFADSCSTTTCPQHPSAECRVSKCDCRATFWSGDVEVTSTCTSNSGQISQIAVGEECNGPVPNCFANMCNMATCPQHPSAECRTSKCDCKAQFWSGGVDVTSTCNSNGGISKIAVGEECNGRIANCFADTCITAVCPQNPSAECRMSKCDCRATFWSGQVEVTSTCNNIATNAQRTPIAMGEECNGRMAQCFINSCVSATCPQNPSAECRMSKCDCSATFWSGGVDITSSCSKAVDQIRTAVPTADQSCINNCFYPPCLMSHCDAYPQAECRNHYCNSCTARYFVGTTEVTDKCQYTIPSFSSNNRLGLLSGLGGSGGWGLQQTARRRNFLSPWLLLFNSLF